MRGKVYDGSAHADPVGITPAYAGKSDVYYYVNYNNRGSPPRVRGKVHISTGQVGGVGITPAYAGKRPSHTSGGIRG